MIPLYKPYMPAELPELNAILHSGALAYGKHGKEFEKKLCLYIGVEQLALVNSFNSAILVTLITLGIKPGDEIIASPMACLASNQPFVTIGVKVVWADVDPMTGTLNPESVKQKITSKTKAIFHNHFCGYSGYIDEINLIGSEHGIPVVDDAIEAFGTEYKGKKIGNTGTDVTIYSFQPVRLPTTIDGGAIIFKDKNLFEKSLLVRDSGVDRKCFRDYQGEINPECDITVPGFGATMCEVNSYIGCLQMEKVEELISKQRENAENWKQKIKNEHATSILLGNNPWQLPNYWVFGILTSDKMKLLQQFREKGLYASGIHLPNNLYSVFEKNEQLSGVNEFHSKFLAVPSGWWVNK